MDQGVTGSSDWWQAVCSIADMVTSGWYLPEQVNEISAALEEKGFRKDAITRAIEWLESAAMTGDVFGALAVTNQSALNERMIHPLETAGIHPDLLRSVMACRRKGIVHPDTFEQLMESIRGLDSRDWTAEEIEHFVDEIIANSGAFAGIFSFKSVNSTTKPTQLN
jgi:uncharacterized protein Smg (DUF494 family)